MCYNISVRIEEAMRLYEEYKHLFGEPSVDPRLFDIPPSYFVSGFDHPLLNPVNLNGRFCPDLGTGAPFFFALI